MQVLEPFAVVCKQRVPLRRRAVLPDRARVLFLSMYHLGWKTWSRCIERYTPQCPELAAVPVHVVQPRWRRLLTRPLPRPIGRSVLSPSRAWRWYVRRHLSRLILSREFDAVFVNSQILAPGLIEPCRASGTKLMVCTDVTGPAYVRDLVHQPAASRSWKEERAIFSACSLTVPMAGIVVGMSQRARGSKSTGDRRLPRLLFCGNDWRRKGGPRLLQWHQKHWSDLAELHLVSKDADVRPGLKNVVNHGAVPNERLLGDILPETDVFCLPTTSDMSPFAVTEAQAFGIPAVVSKIGGMANLVQHGKTGYLIPPQDEEGFVFAVSSLLRQPELRAVMGQAAAEHARMHLDASVLIPRLLTRIVREALAA